MSAVRRASRTGARLTLAAALLATSTLPASAASPDLMVIASGDRAVASAGDTVRIDVQVAAPAGAADARVAVDLPAGLTYIDGTSRVDVHDALAAATDDFEAGAPSYATGTGWDAPWREVGDDGLPGAGALAHDPIGGALVLRPGASTVALERTMTLPVDATSVAFAATVADLVPGMGAGDVLTVGLAFDGGADAIAVAHVGGSGDAIALEADVPARGARTVTVRLEPTSTSGDALRGFRVDDAVLTAASPTTTTTLAPAGDPASLAGTVDLDQGDVMSVALDARVDAVLDADLAALTVGVRVATAADAMAGGATLVLPLERQPVMDADVDVPPGIRVGDGVPVDVALRHGSASDGAAVCGLTVAADGEPLGLRAGDDGDACLEPGEEWRLGRVVTGATRHAGARSLVLRIDGTDPTGAAVTLARTVPLTVLDTAAPAEAESTTAPEPSASPEPEITVAAVDGGAAAAAHAEPAHTPTADAAPADAAEPASSSGRAPVTIAVALVLLAAAALGMRKMA